jgi:polar amino acid transport system substrate-binding protein
MFSRSRLYIAAGAFAVGQPASVTYAQGTKTVINAATVPKYPPFEFKDPACPKTNDCSVVCRKRT